MKKKQDEWKNYIKMAKKRVNGNTNKGCEAIYLNAEPMPESEIKKWNQIIAEIVASDEFVYDPIGKMIDREKYDRMTNESKGKYVLDLSKIYLRLRDRLKNK